MSEEYWFARRFPLSDPRKAIAPVHWKGWAVSAVFATALTIGALAFAWLGASGHLAQGIVVFVVAAALGAGWFISVAYSKADKTRTVADYKKDAQRV